MNINISINKLSSVTFNANKKAPSKADLEALVNQNKTNREIAEQYHISNSYVRFLRQKYELPPERNPFPREEFIRLVENGNTDREIANATGLSYQYTGTLRRSLGLDPQSTAIKQSKIENLIKEGKKNSEIAQTLGISYQYLISLKKRYGLSNPKPIISEDQIKELVLKGMSDCEISKRLGGAGVRRIADIRNSLGINHYRSIDQKRLKMVKDLALEGKLLKEIASTAGISISWASTIVSRLNLNKVKNEYLKSQILTLIEEGKSTKEIADFFKKSIGWVYYQKNKFKI